MRTRTICDLQGNRHTLELGTDYPLLDGRPCIFVEITHERIQLAHTEALQPISLATGEFWRDVAGDSPTPEDAGELYASYLAQWVAQRTSVDTLRSTLMDVLDASSPLSPSFPEYRLDPMTTKILGAFDGSVETTTTLAHILKQSPEVVCQWAAQQEISARGPIQSTIPAVSFDADPLLRKETPSVGESPSSTWFRWTEEREQMLKDAITEHAGSLDQVNTTVTKEIARKLNWPWKSVEYKVCRMKRQREGHQDGTVKEDDRSTIPQSHKLRDLFRTAS